MYVLQMPLISQRITKKVQSTYLIKTKTPNEHLRNKFPQTRTDLNIIIKHAISLSVTLQQPKGPFTLEVLKLQKDNIIICDNVPDWALRNAKVNQMNHRMANSTCTITFGQRVKTASMNSSITETYSSPSRRCSCSPRSEWQGNKLE